MTPSVPRSIRRCTAETRRLPAREGGAGLHFCGAALEESTECPIEPVQWRNAYQDPAERRSADRGGSSRNAASRSTRMAALASLKLSARTIIGHHDARQPEASEESATMKSKPGEQQTRSSPLSALRQAHSRPRRAHSLAKRRRAARPRGPRDHGRVRSAAPPPRSEYVDEGPKLGLRTRSACGETSVTIRSPAGARPDDERARRSSDIRTADRGELQPEPIFELDDQKHRVGGIEAHAGEHRLRVYRVVWQVEDTCQVLRTPVSDRGFARIFSPQNKLRIMTRYGPI